MRLFFYREGLKDFDNVSTRKVRFHGINMNSFFIVDEEKQKFYLYLSEGKHIQELPFEHHESTIYSRAENIDMFDVKTPKGIVSFYVNNATGQVYFSPDSITHNLKEMNFLKEGYLSYKGYDIEWTGENYQVSDYFTKRIVSLSPIVEQVYKDIDSFLEWKNEISTDPEYYKEKGFDIKVVSSGKGYPVFPHSYEITCPNGDKLKGMGISNVFEKPEEAVLKACYKCHDMLTSNLI